MPAFRRSRIQKVPAPPLIDPISGRVYGAPPDRELDNEALAAGQAALSTMKAPGQHLRELKEEEEGWDGEGAQAAQGYDPRRSAWAGTE